MRRLLRIRITIEGGLAVVSLALVVLTLTTPEWIEEFTGLDPDAGSGAAEWVIAFAFAFAAVIAAGRCRRDVRQLKAIPPGS